MQAVSYFLNYSAAKLKIFQDNVFVLVYDSCFHLIVGQYDSIKPFIEQYNLSKERIFTKNPHELLCNSFIYLFKNDLKEIPRLLDKVYELCNAHMYKKDETKNYQLLANALLSFVNKKEIQFSNDLMDLDKYTFEIINKEKKNAASWGYHFFDPFSAALLCMAIKTEFLTMPESPYRFFDINWTTI